MNDLQTYFQEENPTKPIFNWPLFLARTDQTREEWDEANDRAGDWVTCACGNQCAAIPRDHHGEPRDEVLAALGMDFYDAIDCENAEEARQVLDKIEARSIDILTNMGVLSAPTNG